MSMESTDLPEYLDAQTSASLIATSSSPHESQENETNDSSQIAIIAEGLSKQFRSHGGYMVNAVDDISFTFKKQQLVAITGASGSGKTTLLYLLGALDHPTTGGLMVNGVDLVGMSKRQENLFRRQHVGFVFQGFHLIPNLTALENVLLPVELAGGGLKKASMKERAQDLLNQVGINEDRHRHRPGQLSAGQQQRVAIARALINDPPVLLADEPTGNLDRKNGRRIMELLQRLAEQGRTVVMVTHDRSMATLADTQLEMEDGRIENEFSRFAPVIIKPENRTHLKKKGSRRKK